MAIADATAALAKGVVHSNVAQPSYDYYNLQALTNAIIGLAYTTLSDDTPAITTFVAAATAALARAATIEGTQVNLISPNSHLLRSIAVALTDAAVAQ